MHSSRNFVRCPQVYRVVRSPAVVPTRTMSLFSAPPFYTRVPSTPSFPLFTNEMTPFFRLMDDLAASSRTIERAFDHFPQLTASRHAEVQFQPRFDVREVADGYELRGDLPGVESQHIEVEFTDAQTLVIRGRTETQTTRGTPPAPTTAAIESAAPTPSAEDTTTTIAANPEGTTVNTVVPDTSSDAASVHSTSSYQKATVEDEDVATSAPASESATPAQPTPAESTTSEAAPATNTVNTATTSAPIAESQQSNSQVQNETYWLSERTTGTFQRVFRFPTRVNQEAVKASLRNGVLNVVVPKAVKPTSRRINVE